MTRDIVQKTKILFLITKGNFYGAQRYVFNLATGLDASRYEVSVACGPAPSGTDPRSTLAARLSKLNIRTILVPELQRDVSIFRDFTLLPKLRKLIETEHPHILHVNSSKIAGIGSLSGRFARVPKIVTTVHGWAFNESRPWWQRQLIRLASWITVLLSDHVILLSEFDQTCAKWMPFSKHKFTLIRNGIEDIEPMARTSARRALARKIAHAEGKAEQGLASARTLWIGSVSELHRNKGIAYFIEALALMRRELDQRGAWIYAVMGEGDERRALEYLIRERKLERNVKLLGYVENAGEYLKACDVFVMPSLKEGFPYALLEAGRSGASVIATTVGGIPEIITDMEEGILVRPQSSAELKAALRFFVNDEKMRSTFGAKFAMRVTAAFSMRDMIAATEHVYRS